MTNSYWVERIDHVQLAMPPGGEEQGVAFYEVLLGIPQVPKPPELAIRGGCWFEHPGLRIHLGAEEGFQPARKAHPALVVTGIEPLCAALEAAGHPVQHRTDVPEMPQWFVHDPFGNRIELVPSTD